MAINKDEELDLGHLAEEFNKLLTNVPTPQTSGDAEIVLEEGERREVSILFLDLVGYTRLAERLDPEKLQFVVSNTLQVFTNQIKKYGGTIENYIGDAILALFGLEHSHQDDSLHAVLSARAILDSIEDINSILSRKDIEIKARIGINRGLIVTGQVENHSTVTGESINIAQRLESNAPENGILISDIVYQDCGQRFQCTPLEPLFVKNKEAPLTVYRVVGEVPQTSRSRPDSIGPMVGREREISSLVSAWEHAQNGQLTSLQMIGEEGLGKRDIVHHFLENLKLKLIDPKTLIITADAFGLQPFHALSDLVAACQKKSAQEHQTTISGYDVYLHDLCDEIPLPKHAVDLSKMDPHARQVETILAVKKFLMAAAEIQFTEHKTPLIIILDKVEWYTPASKDALAQILKTFPPQLQVLWVLLAPNRDALKWVPELPSSTTLHLSPLTERDTARYLAERFKNHPITAPLCGRIYQATGGKPYYIEAIAKVLENSKDLSGFDLAEHMPSSIKALVLSQFDNLARPHRFGLQMASIVGREFSMNLFQYILDRIKHPLEAKVILQELVAQNHLELTESCYIVSQPMMSEVAYSTILLANRKKLHRLVAEWIEQYRQDQLENYAPYLARQWKQAEEYSQAIKYYEQSGRAARSRFASKDAIHYYERIIALKEKHPQACEMDPIIDATLRLVDLYDDRGDPDQVKYYVELGFEKTALHDHRHLRFYLRQILCEDRYGDHKRAMKDLDEFLTSNQLQKHPEIYLRAVLARARIANERGEDATGWIEKAQEIDKLNTSESLRYLLNNQVFNHYKNSDELKEAESYLKRVLAVGEQNAYTRNMNHLFYCSFMWDRGDNFTTIVESANLATTYFQETGWSRGVGWGSFYQGAGLWRLGQFSQARDVITQGLSMMEQARDSYMIERLELLLAAVFLFQGNKMKYHLGKKKLLEQAKDESEAKIVKREFLLFEAQSMEAGQNLEDLLQQFQELASLPLSKVQKDEVTLSHALVTAQLGKIDETLRLINPVRAHIHDNEKKWLIGILTRIDGLVAAKQGNKKACADAFAESVRVFESLQAKFSTELSRRTWSVACREVSPSP